MQQDPDKVYRQQVNRELPLKSDRHKLLADNAQT